MFDAHLRRWIDPPINAAGRWMAARGFNANAVTLAGVPLAIGAAVAIAHGQMEIALMLIVVNRLIDGLDGAIARTQGITDFGGYLDSLADYVFYVAVPLGFAGWSFANAVAAATLIGAFTLTSVSFLAYAAIAARHEMISAEHKNKSFFYSSGIAEGGETIAVFIAMCIWPAGFVWLAFGFAGLCLVTVLQRIAMARQNLAE